MVLPVHRDQGLQQHCDAHGPQLSPLFASLLLDFPVLLCEAGGQLPEKQHAWPCVPVPSCLSVPLQRMMLPELCTQPVLEHQPLMEHPAQELHQFHARTLLELYLYDPKFDLSPYVR